MRRHTGALWISTMPRSGEVNEWPGKIRAMGGFAPLEAIYPWGGRYEPVFSESEEPFRILGDGFLKNAAGWDTPEDSVPCPVHGFPLFRGKISGEPLFHAQPVFENTPGMERLDGGIGELPGGDGNDHVQHFSGSGGHPGQYRRNGGGKLRMFIQNIQQPSAAQVRGNGLRFGQQVREAPGREILEMKDK